MVNKIEFKAKNEGLFDLINAMVDFDNGHIDKIKMNHLKTMLCGNFIGIDKLERLKLLQNDPLVKEFVISIKEPETASRFIDNFSFKITQMLRDVNFKILKKITHDVNIQYISKLYYKSIRR
jgi:hypothetical protein